MMHLPTTGDTSPPLTQDEQYIGLSLSPALEILLPNTGVTEVISLSVDQIVSLPEMAPCVMGLTHWRGEALWLVDFSIVMGQVPLYSIVPPSQQSRFDGLVVQYQQHTVGLVVEQITRLHQLQPQSIRPLSLVQHIPSIPGLQAAWISPNDERHWIIDPVAVAQILAQDLSSKAAV